MKRSILATMLFLGVTGAASAVTSDVSYCANASNTKINNVKYQFMTNGSTTAPFMFVSTTNTPTGRASCNTNSYSFVVNPLQHPELARSIDDAHASGATVHLRGNCTCRAISSFSNDIDAEVVSMFKVY